MIKCMIETDIFFVLKPGSIQAVGFGVIPNSFSHKFMKEKKKAVAHISLKTFGFQFYNTNVTRQHLSYTF